MGQSINLPFQPSISILIPTLNSGKVLEACLKSIDGQDYPKDKIEIIVADGGSTDNTLEIAKKYRAKIYNNPLRTGEAGKAVALKHAKNELVAFIDSDNILPQIDWLKNMVEPFNDPEIIGSEPLEFTYQQRDGFIDRYCALLGMNDPLCLFLGNYDRKSLLTGKWTNLFIKQKDIGRWIEVILRPSFIPTIGANGTLLRHEILMNSGLVSDYFFDVDIIAGLASIKPIKFAKVKIGITHYYCGNDIKLFFCKQKRRARDYNYYQKSGIRTYPWQKQNKIGLLKFIFYCITLLPLLYQTIKGYLKKPDPAWFFHPLACWITLLVYSGERIIGLLKPKQMSRIKWKQ